MEEREIISFMKYPDKGLVDYAISCANLTAPELLAIQRRVLFGETLEEAAESLLISRSTVKRRCDAGFEKLDQCWSGKPWIASIIKQ